MAAASGSRRDGYAPIGSYGFIGDGRTVALVADDGSIDWLPAPRIDSPPVFARILDRTVGGAAELCPVSPYTVRRRYRAETPVLETTFTTADGRVTVVDALNRQGWHPLPWTELARRVRAESGRVRLRWQIAPGRRFGDAEPWRLDRPGGVPMLRVGDQMLAIVVDGCSTIETTDHAVSGEIDLEAGQEALVAVLITDREPVCIPPAGEIVKRVESTCADWRSWRSAIDYQGPYSDAVLRSIEVLKLLTLAASGANAAAPTTSLPERIGGDRNYDYRYTWVRDASFALDVMTGVGLMPDVHASLSWLLTAVSRTAPHVLPFYTLTGDPAPAATAVDALEGWRGSSPVHIGNQAHDQDQLGSYGDLFDAVWLYVQNGGQLDPATGSMLAEMADAVCDRWRQRDSGLWELEDRRHYTSSKIGCWVAVDRAVRLAHAEQLPAWHDGRWQVARDEIRQWVDRHCWSESKSSYTMYDDTDALDAAVLLAARTGFCSGDDPRLASTIRAIQAELSAGGSLLHRYSGMSEQEGAFVACSFWLAEAKAISGDIAGARKIVDGMLGHCNDLGLLSEEIDPSTGELLGNFPQGLSHLALIGAARAIARAQE